MLGRQSVYADEAYKGNFIAGGFIKDKDLTNHLPDNWRDFNRQFIPLFLEQNPDKTRIAAGLACGMLWTISKGIKIGDTVLCPDGSGNYYTGEVVGNYEYHIGAELPHRRSVRWYSRTISRDEMSEGLRNSSGSIGTVSTITQHAIEIEALISGSKIERLESVIDVDDNTSSFGLERILEEFLVENWENIDLGKRYDIYEEDGERIGQQYQTDDKGRIDILAISKDKKELLVVELKRGRVSDEVVGQIQRYMGFIQEVLAEEGQTVRGVIIGKENDIKFRRALSVARNIDFYTYKLKGFELEKK